MHVGKLNTGRIVEIMRWNVPVQFDRSRNDFVLIRDLDKFKYMQWINTTQVVWHHNFEF